MVLRVHDFCGLKGKTKSRATVLAGSMWPFLDIGAAQMEPPVRGIRKRAPTLENPNRDGSPLDPLLGLNNGPVHFIDRWKEDSLTP